MKLSTELGRVRLIGFLEGISFLLLLGIAMPLKYLAGEPGAVRVIGMAHGVLFLMYVLVVWLAHVEYRWPLQRTSLLLLASILPFGPFVADRRILRSLPEA